MGKSKGKKFFFRFVNFYKKGCKIAAQEKVWFWQILHYRARFVWYRCFTICLFVFLPPLPVPVLPVQCQIILNFQNFWNGKKWSQILKLLLIKGVKSPCKKKFCLASFALPAGLLLVSVLLSASVKRCFVSRMRDFLK